MRNALARMLKYNAANVRLSLLLHQAWLRNARLAFAVWYNHADTERRLRESLSRVEMSQN